MTRDRTVKLKIVLDFTAFNAAMAGVRKQMEAMATALGQAASNLMGFRGRYMLGMPEPHSFRPDYDLACTVNQCTLTAEEH